MFVATAIALISVWPFSQHVAAQTLQEELYQLVQTHPRIEEARAVLRRAQESVKSSRSGYLPTVSLTGSAGGNVVSNPTTRGTNHDNELVRFNALGIEIRQNLYNGGLTPNSVDSALMARDSVTYALEGTVQAVMLQGITAYLNVLRLNELIRVARARERTIREQLQLETERVERGAGIEVDVLQAKSRLQLAIEQRVDLEGQLRQAMSDYILNFNREPDITQMRLAPSPMEIVPASIDDALFTARDENPLIVAREFLARSARFTVEAQRSGYVPTFDLVGRMDHESNVGGTRNLTKDSAVLIEMSWEIFSGFRTDAAVASSQETLIEQLAAADRIQRQVERQVRQAWTKLENTRERKELLLNAVSIAQEVFTARQKLRDAGKETTLNVLDAENEVFQAEQNLIRADYDTRVAVYELAVAMGIMSPALLGIDVQIIENPEDYIVGAGDVEDPEPDPRVQARREKIEALSAPSLVRPSTQPAPETGVPETETPDNSSQDNTPSDGEPSVIEPPPETTGAVDPTENAGPSTQADAGNGSRTSDSLEPKSDALAVASEMRSTNDFQTGDFAIQAAPQSQTDTGTAESSAPDVVAPTEMIQEAPDTAEQVAVPLETTPATATASSVRPSFLEKVRSLLGLKGSSRDSAAAAAAPSAEPAPVEALAIAEPAVSAPVPIQAVSLEPIAPRAVAQSTTLNGGDPAIAVRPSIAALAPVEVPALEVPALEVPVLKGLDTDAIVVRDAKNTIPSDSFDIPGTFLFGGDVPPPR